MPVLRNLLEPGKELAGAPTVPLTAGVETRNPTDAFSENETQPVYFAPQYKTRYPFYRWVGWWAGVLVMFFPPALGFEPVSSGL